jgi:hypothetical protein
MVALTQSISTLFIASMPVSCCALTLRFPTIEVCIAANEQVFAMAGHSMLVTLVPKLIFICCRS